MTLRKELWVRISGSLICPLRCPLVPRMGSKERENHSMSSSLRLLSRKADKPRIQMKRLRAGYCFDYGLIHIGGCLLVTVNIMLDAHNTLRKIFTFIVSLNLVGLILTTKDVWQYPRVHTNALVLGNLLTAILVRNELFGRFLYLSVNTLFAKVRGILTSLHQSHAV
jgi:hypothetical protein